MSHASGQKRRPPPISIPAPRPPARVVPGPNAFAIAGRTKQDEWEQSEHGIAQTRPQTRDRSNTSSDNDNGTDHGSRLPRSKSTTGRFRESAMTTFTNLVDQARSTSPRKSPRKSDYSYSNASSASRHASTSRSRHSERSHRSHVSNQLYVERLGEENMTTRAELEAQSERKFFKMMGQVPETPIAGAPLDSHVVKDLRPGRTDSGGSKAEREERVKSPRKKIFGMSIPSFRASTNAPTPPMPPKVARVLGTSPPGKPNRRSPHSSNTSTTFVPRSDTSKSLPSKLYNQHSHHNRRPNQYYGSASRSRVRMAGRRSPSKGTDIHTTKASPKQSAMPPTPPQKDTPVVNPREVNEFRWFDSDPWRVVEQQDEVEFVDTGMKLHLPGPQKLDPVTSRDGTSPTKFCPYGVEDYAKLIEGQPLMSAHGEVDCSDEEHEGSNSAPSESQKSVPPQTHDKRWSEDGHLPPRTSLRAYLDPNYQLPATVYRAPTTLHVADANGSPSKKATADRLLLKMPPAPLNFTEPEKPKQEPVGIVPPAEANGVMTTQHSGKMARSNSNFATRVMQELRVPVQSSPLPENKCRDGLQPDQSSSQLTDMLNGVSPFRNEYRDFQPNCPSAIPSPLHRIPGQPHPILGNTHGPTALADVSLGDHFFMTNEHIDVVGCTLYDFVALCSKNQTTAASSKHEQLLSHVEQQFADIKDQMNSINEKVDHGANQSHNIGVQLSKIQELIKTDIVEPLNVQTKKMADMERNIRDLQKVVHNLQKSFDQRTPSSGAAFSSPHVVPVFPLPNHRSQPSLAGYYDSNDVTRESMPRVPPVIPETRYNGNGPWPRPHYGRDVKENNTHPFSSTNPYSTSTQFGHSFLGGYPQYGFSPGADQQYGLDQGPSK